MLKETLDLAWSKDEVSIWGLDGVEVRKEIRKNHLEQMTGILEDGTEYPVTEHEYAVFAIPWEADCRPLKEAQKRMGVTIEKRVLMTEIACHSPQLYHAGALAALAKMGVIRYSWKHRPKEKGRFPFYVNAKGWQILYNLLGLAKEAAFRAVAVFRRKKEEEVRS